MAQGIGLTASYLVFESWAFQKNATGGHNERIVKVLCGDNPPTITDGYAIWSVISRPLRQGLTIPQGFNPAKLKIEVRFGVWDGKYGFHGWDTGTRQRAPFFDPRPAEWNETQISNLHWMAGGNSPGGPSPVVYINSFRFDKGVEVRTDLMPRQYRGVPWIFDSGINWGNSLRDRNGSRIYQEADFTVMGYTAPRGGLPVPQENVRINGNFYKTNSLTRTARKIAAVESSPAPGSAIERLARNICKESRNNPCRATRLHLDRRSIDWKLPTGVDVWVPSRHI